MKTRLLIVAAIALAFFLAAEVYAYHLHSTLEQIVRKQKAEVSGMNAVAREPAKQP